MNEVRNILKTMDYGPAPEATENVEYWLDKNNRKFGHFINGKFKPFSKANSFSTSNPATGTKLADVSLGLTADVEEAASAAKDALKEWSKTPGESRARYLYGLARQIQKHARLFSVLESLDNGKPIRESRDIDIPLVARHFYHHAGWAHLMDERFPEHQGAGVCGQIIPWNFPLLMLAWKVAPALAAGCTVVLKPAEYTPLTALLFAEICKTIKLPDGVFNLVNGDGSTGELIVNQDLFDKIAFTGSTEVGRAIRLATAGTGKKLSLELGGKSPFIVFNEADIDGAIEGVVDAIWFNQGEVCCAGSRILVQEGIEEKFHKRLKARMESLRVGDPLDKTTDIGAVVHPKQIENISSRVKEGVDTGAVVWQPSWASNISYENQVGCFFPPSLFCNVEPASKLAQEEIFGPVVVSMGFRTPDEAIQLANNSKYGLAASIWSQNLDTAVETARNLKAGIVWINSTNLFDASAGFGGYKESGFGREGGHEGMMEYLVPSWVSRAKDVKVSSFHAQPFPSNEKQVKNLDRTMKNYIGGKQARPDSGYSYPILDATGQVISEVGMGSRKDIRNAVEAANVAGGWASITGHQRAQILYFLAENLEAREEEFIQRLLELNGSSRSENKKEFKESVNRVCYYAAWADKYDGDIRAPSQDLFTLRINEPWGVMGISCPDEYPLLSMISTIMPAIAMGNRVVVTPSPKKALIAGDFYQVLDTSDVPGGVVNFVSGDRDELAKVMANHDDISCHWFFGSKEGCFDVEKASAGSLKATWVNNGKSRDWMNRAQGQGTEFLFHAVQSKTIWLPYGT